jgi:hypothetical protein
LLGIDVIDLSLAFEDLTHQVDHDCVVAQKVVDQQRDWKDAKALTCGGEDEIVSGEVQFLPFLSGEHQIGLLRGVKIDTIVK